MQLPSDLLRTAERLASEGMGEATQADLRRAVSATYYAVFHALCALVADSIVPVGTAGRAERAWLHVYRALDHGKMKQRLLDLVMQDGTVRPGFPDSIRDIASAFGALQEDRHEADYDPRASFF